MALKSKQLGDLKTSSLLEIIQNNSVSVAKPYSRKKGRIYASEAVCGRKAALNSKLSGMPNIVKFNNITGDFYGKIGGAIEDVILNNLEPVLKQYDLATDINLGGRIDGIVFRNGELEVVEVKSCDALPNSPKPEHHSQALIYSTITGIKNYSLIYVSRNIVEYVAGEQQMKWVEFNYENTDYDEKYSTVYEIIKATKYGELNLLPPKGRLMRNKTVCNSVYCPFVERCWNGDLDELDDPNLTSFNLSKLEREIEAETKKVLKNSPKVKKQIELAYEKYNTTFRKSKK